MDGAGFDRIGQEEREGRDVCIWMTAGLITYKLCDRRFDCDHCPLDAALTQSRAGAGIREVAAEAETVWSLPEDRLYGPGRFWLLPENGDRLRVGLDAFAGRLLSRLDRLRLLEVGGTLASGAPCCVVEIAGGEVALGAPLAARVSGVNLRVARAPCLVVRDPYGAGWLYDLEISASEILAESLPAAEMSRRLTIDLKHFRRRVASYLLADGPLVGRVMADGGEPLADLHQLLGREEFLRLLREILG